MIKIPKPVEKILKELEKNNFQAFVVGGCVRDSLQGIEPYDWDIATNAKPEEIVKVFPKNFQDNDFGMITVLTNSKKQNLKEIQIMPYRIESQYTDKRHPDKVSWVKTIEEDLARRDFTVNAMAWNKELVDPFNGQQDLKNKVIKAVGDPKHRFSEDALRMMRAVRFATVLEKDWQIDFETEKAIQKNAKLLKMISQERIRDEFLKIIMCPKASNGIEMLRELGLLTHIIPELEQGYGVAQAKHHINDVYEHNLLSLDYAAKQNYNIYVRIAALLHDIGKPKTKKGKGEQATFYNHEIVGAKMTQKILNRLRFSKKDNEKITKLVRYHLFYYNVDEVSESSVRRLVKNAGTENMEELLQVRYCDRIGSGCPKAEPYKLRHLKYIIERVAQDPISVVNLKISGNDIIKLLGIKPGPQIGQILDILLGDVLEDPKKNKKKDLIKKTEELGKLKQEELKKLAFQARKQRKEIETKRDQMTKKKYWVS